MENSHFKCSYIVFITFELLIASTVTVASPYCPPGLIHNTTTEANSTDNTHCICSKILKDIVDCDQENGEAWLAIGYCMTFNFTTNTTIIGKCPYNNNYTLTKHGRQALYSPLPDSVFELEEHFCGQYNRQGILCSECKHSYKASITSYSMDCIPCEEKYKYLGLTIFISLQLLPLTVLYLIIIVFDLRFTKNPWQIFILFCQVIVYMLNYDRQLYSQLIDATNGNSVSSYFVKAVLTFYGLWNLDFLPNIIPSHCFYLPVRGQHELLYKYHVALYPLFLIALMYFCVHLYSRNFRVVVVPWKAIKYCLNFKLCCGCRWILERISSRSIANSFSSFLILAYHKILFVSLDLLLPIPLYELHDSNTTTSFVPYYGPEKQYFGDVHLPFALIAVFLIALFTLLPALLLILHLLFAHRLLCLRSCLSMHLFAENFQGWFKNETDRTHDFRTLSALHPLVRITLALSISLVTLSVQPSSLYSNATWMVPGIVFTCCSLLFALARPYKLQYMNTLESLVFALLGGISFLVSYRVGFYIAILLSVTPMLTAIGYITYRLFKIVKQKLSSFKVARTSSELNEYSSLVADQEPFNADRLDNPAHYLEHSTSKSNDKASDESVSINIEVIPVCTYGATNNCQ